MAAATLQAVAAEASGASVFRSANRAEMSVTLRVPNTDAGYLQVKEALEKIGLAVDDAAHRGVRDVWTEIAFKPAQGHIDLSLR